MSLSKILYPLLSTGSIKEHPSQHDWKIGALNVKGQTDKQTKSICFLYIRVALDFYFNAHVCMYYSGPMRSDKQSFL